MPHSARHITALVIFLLLPMAAGAQTSVPLRVYLGPVPNPAGLTIPLTDEKKASYQDMRSELAKDAQLKRRLVLAESADDADVILSVNARGEKPRGSSTTTASQVNGVAVASTTENTVNSLTAILTVAGTTQSVDLDGATGLKWVSFKAQARNLLKQTADWGDANRAAIAKLKAGQ